MIKDKAKGKTKRKIRDKIRKKIVKGINITIPIFKENIDIFIFFIIIYIKSISYASYIMPKNFNYQILFLPTISPILILVGISFLFKRLNRVIILYIFNIIITTFIIGDLIFYNIFKDVMTYTSIKNIIIFGFNINPILNLKINYIGYLFDLILLIPIVYIYYRGNKSIFNKNFKFISRGKIALIIISIATIFNTIEIRALAKEQPGLLTTMSNKLYISKNIGMVNFHLVDSYNLFKNNKGSAEKVSPIKEKEIENFLKDNLERNGADFKGEGEGKNLIIIQVESLQQFVINRKINGKYITPNINRWIEKSLYFDNFFHQVSSGNTSDAEFMINNSIYPIEGSSVYYAYAANKFDSLPKRLDYKDYYTSVFHGYNEGFWNRSIMYRAQGFQNFYGESSFDIDEELIMGLSDKSFFNQTHKNLRNLREPYYSFIVTLTSHYPFKDKSKNLDDLDVGKYKDSFLGDYFKAVHYTDAQIGRFLDKLEEDGILNKSVVVLYGDHSAINGEKNKELYDFIGEKEIDDFKRFTLQKVPMFIHFPKDKYKGINHRYCGQMDIYPTLSNLFDIDAKYLFGQDLLNAEQDKVIFRSGSFIYKDYLYISWIDSYFNLMNGEKIKETEALKEKRRQVLRELKYSDDLLRYNLIDNIEHH